MEKPNTIDEYIEWLEDIEPNTCSKKYANYYDHVMKVAKDKFMKSNFWIELTTKWNEINTSYYLQTGYNLFGEKLTDVYIKPYTSVVDKTYRKNIVLNSNWPAPPENAGGWLMPRKCQSALNDCLRTTIIVKCVFR